MSDHVLELLTSNHLLFVCGLSCVKDGQANPTCQQKTTYSVNDIREDKSGCADPKAPVKVLVDFTLLVNKKKVTIKDSIYCCNSTMKGNSRILPLLQQCCGTQFAPCDVFKQSKAKKYAGSLKCCGVPKLQDSLSTNCRPLNSTLKGLLPEMNLRYLMKKSGMTKDDIKRSPNGLDDGFGLCHFVQSGRWDVTKVLSENVGYGIYARCNDKKERKGAGDVKNNKCSDTGDKKYMFQHKQNSNLCCNRASMMHRTKDEIIKGCCLHNQVEDHGPGKLDNSTLAGRLREDEFCSNAKIPCCIGSCTAKKCGAKKDCGDSVFLCDSAKPKDTFTMCLNDYNLSDPIDSEFKRDSSP